jgi:hypothetical protein
VATWKTKQALAHALWSRGAIKAQYVGQASGKLADLLNKIQPKSTPWQPGHAFSIARELEASGWMRIVSTGGNGQGIIQLIEWIGPDPDTIEWEPVRPARSPSADTELIEVLAAEVADLRHQMDQIKLNVHQTVTQGIRLAVEELRKEGIW